MPHLPPPPPPSMSVLILLIACMTCRTSVYCAPVPHQMPSPVESGPWHEAVHQPFQAPIPTYPHTTIMPQLDMHQSFPQTSPSMMAEQIATSNNEVVGQLGMDGGHSLHPSQQGMVHSVLPHDPQAVSYVSIHPEHTPYHQIVSEGK